MSIVPSRENSKVHTIEQKKKVQCHRPILDLFSYSNQLCCPFSLNNVYLCMYIPYIYTTYIYIWYCNIAMMDEY